MNEYRQDQSFTKAEWMAAAALCLSFVQGAYIAGVEIQRLNDQDRRLASLEAAQAASAGKIEQLLITTTRIDANVTALASTSADDGARKK